MKKTTTIILSNFQCNPPPRRHASQDRIQCNKFVVIFINCVDVDLNALCKHAWPTSI